MSDTQGSRLWDQPVVRVIRFVVPWMLLAVIMFRINGIYEDYKVSKSQQERAAAEATATLSSGNKKVTLKKGTKLIVMKSGLNLRAKPSASGSVVRKLDKGEVLVLVRADPDWLQTKTKDDKTGWVRLDPLYTRVAE